MVNQQSGRAIVSTHAVNTPPTSLQKTVSLPQKPRTLPQRPRTLPQQHTTPSQKNDKPSTPTPASIVTTKHETKQPATIEQNVIVVCGFAAIGKSTFIEEACTKKFVVEGICEWGYYNDVELIDLDSSNFRNKPEWPQNYLKAIRERLCETRIRRVLLISTHLEIFSELLKERVNLVLVRPQNNLRVKAEWEKRILERDQAKGVPIAKSMWHKVNSCWGQWIKEYGGYEEQYPKHCKRYEMSKDEYLVNAADQIPGLKNIFQKGWRSSK